MAQRRRWRPKDPGWRVRRWLVGGALVVAAAGVGVAGTAGLLILAASPAGAQPIGDCSTTTGVIVVVDFAHWGGTIERGCAATPTTGYDALHTAGFTTAGDEHDGPAFICRIDTKPTPTQTSCVNTPPASAYWSYWHADTGQTTWSYSQLGAMTYKPPAGSVTAWVFGSTNVTGTSGTGKPTFTPTQVRAANPAPAGGTTTTTTAAPVTTTTTAPSGAGRTGTTSSTGGGQSSGSGDGGGASAAGGTGGSPSTSSTGTTPSTGTKGSGSTTAPSTAARGSTTTTVSGGRGGGVSSTGKGDRSDGGRGGSHDSGRASAAPKIVDVDPAPTRTKSPAGSPLPVVIGVVVAVVLAGGGGVIAWRRRAGQAG